MKTVLRRTISAFALIATALASLPCHAQRTWEEGISEFLGASRYTYFLPQGYDPSERYPLFLYLHGAGLVGSDNRHVQARELEDLIALTDTDYPAILLAPQLLSGSWNPSNANDRTDEILAEVFSDLSVDLRRVYVGGTSAGGFGTLRYLEHFHVDNPEVLRFAAGAPTAGASISSGAVETLSEVPIWLSHGGGDNRVNPDFSRNTFRALAGVNEIEFTETAADGPTAVSESGATRYTEYPGAPHNTAPLFFGSTELHDWLFTQETLPYDPHPGDANGDTLVTIQDFNLIRDNLGRAVNVRVDGDLDFDGDVDLDDYGLWLSVAPAELVAQATGGVTVPESSALVLAGLGAIASAGRRGARSRRVGGDR